MPNSLMPAYLVQVCQVQKFNVFLFFFQTSSIPFSLLPHPSPPPFFLHLSPLHYISPISFLFCCSNWSSWRFEKVYFGDIWRLSLSGWICKWTSTHKLCWICFQCTLYYYNYDMTIICQEFHILLYSVCYCVYFKCNWRNSCDRFQHVDYKGISQSKKFENYVRATAELKRVDLTPLSRHEKVAFFINIYNAMVIHAFVVQGPPNNLWKRFLVS